MKKFKLYGFLNNNPILITNSDSISPASTFDETLVSKRNSQYSLSFKIADKLPNGDSNLFLDLLSPKNKVRLELDGTTISNVGAQVSTNLFAILIGDAPQLHGLIPNQKITLKNTGAITGLSIDHTYYVLVQNPYSFQLSETYGGSPIDISGTDSFITIQYNTTVIDFIINSSSTEFYQEIIIYSFEAEDYASVLYSKLGMGLTINEKTGINTGTIKELLQEILAQSKINSYYIGASYNYLKVLNYKYKDVINATVSETGVFKIIDFNKNKNSLISFFRDKNLISLDNYILEFNISSLSDDITYSIQQYNRFGIEIENTKFDGEVIYNSEIVNYLISNNFQPAETMYYFTISFYTQKQDPQNLICSDFKLNKILDQDNLKLYIHIDDNFILDYEDFKSTTPSYSYYKKATLKLDNSNLYNGLIELANLFKAYVYFSYDNPNTITFKSQFNSDFNGYRLSPQFNLLNIGRNEESSEFITALNITGNENVVSIIPSIPAAFFSYFQDCIENNFIGEDFFENYGSGIGENTYTDKAIEFANLNPDKKDEYLAFAYACDKVPNFENVIYNIDYFKKIRRISEQNYNIFKDYINNGLRKINIKLRIYSENYQKLKDNINSIEDSVSFDSTNITIENLAINELSQTIDKIYEYNDIKLQIIGDNLLKNSNFGVYGQEQYGDYATQYQIPTGWTVSNTDNKKFQVNRDILSPSENTTVKFLDINSSDSFELYLDYNDMVDIRTFASENGFYTSPFTISAAVYLDSAFNFQKYKPYIALRYKAISGSDYTYTTINKVNLSTSETQKWNFIESHITASSIPISAIGISIVLGVDKLSSFSSSESICYFGDAQLEPRTFRTNWNNEPVAAIDSYGLNMISNSNFILKNDTNEPSYWSSTDIQLFTIGVDASYKNDNENYIEFNWSSGIGLNPYLATNYIDLNLYELGNRYVDFSIYVYRGTNDTLDLPMYIGIGTYTKDKIGQGGNEIVNRNEITLSKISLIENWTRLDVRAYIPFKNDFGDVRYIRGIIGYNKTDTTKPGKNTDKLRFSKPQLEIGNSYTDWQSFYDPDGDRYASYKFIKSNNKLSNDDIVVLDYIDSTKTYNLNKNLYPAESGSYYIVNSTGESFRLSTTKGGSPIPYNNSYDITTEHNWKITSLIVQRKSSDWIILNNQIVDRENSIINYRREIMNLLNIIYDQYYLTPLSIELDNNKIKTNTFLYNLFKLYGFNTIYNNALQDKIDTLKNNITIEYNDYLKNKILIDELITKLDNDELTFRQRSLLESDKAGYISNNENKQFNIGLFAKEEIVLASKNNVETKILGFIDTPQDLETVDYFKYLDVSDISSLVEQVDSINSKYVRIYSLDDTENYLRKIIDYDAETRVLHIEYFTKLAKPYNYYIVDITEDINNPYVNGKYQNELYYYNLLNVFLSSYIYQKSYINDSLWAIRYQAFNTDITAKIISTTNWDYIGNALVTKYPYGNNNDLDYMVKISPESILWTDGIEIESSGNYEFKCLYKVVTESIEDFSETENGFTVQILNSSNVVVYEESVYIINQLWNLNKSSTINLNAGTYKINFINNCSTESTMWIYLYKPFLGLQVLETSDNYLTDEELISLRDNPQLIDYIESSSIIINKEIGLYDYVENLNYSGNLRLLKIKFISELYKNYKNYIFEGFYENSDEITSEGLLEQALLAEDKFKIPNIQYSTSVLDLSALQNYEFLDIKVNDHILIAEAQDRLYKSYTEEETKYLTISEINYNLRDIGSTSITVSIDDEKNRILQKILQVIN